MTEAEQPSPSRAPLVLFGVCVAVSVYGYADGWPAWGLLLIFFAVPMRAFYNWMCYGRLKRYRFLFGIYLVVALVGLFEAWQYQHVPESVTEAIDLPAGPGEPNLFLESNLARVLFELYPERAEILFIRGFQIKLCLEDSEADRYPVCREFRDADLQTIRRLFETALQQKSKTDEKPVLSLRGTADANRCARATTSTQPQINGNTCFLCRKDRIRERRSLSINHRANRSETCRPGLRRLLALPAAESDRSSGWSHSEHR